MIASFEPLQHFLYYAFDPWNFVTNISAGLIQFAVVGLVMYAVWPRFRRAVDRWLHGHLSTHFKELHDKLDAHHKAHNEDLAKLHERLDAIGAPKK